MTTFKSTYIAINKISTFITTTSAVVDGEIKDLSSEIVSCKTRKKAMSKILELDAFNCRLTISYTVFNRIKTVLIDNGFELDIKWDRDNFGGRDINLYASR